MTKGKKARLLYLVLGLICLIGSIWVSFFWMYEYKEASFEQLSKFCEIFLENNPEARGQMRKLCRHLRKKLQQFWSRILHLKQKTAFRKE